jgi:hypothetical protein
MKKLVNFYMLVDPFKQIGGRGANRDLWRWVSWTSRSDLSNTTNCDLLHRNDYFKQGSLNEGEDSVCSTSPITKVGYIKKKIYNICIKSIWSELVCTWRSTVLGLPLQQDFPALNLPWQWEAHWVTSSEGNVASLSCHQPLSTCGQVWWTIMTLTSCLIETVIESLANQSLLGIIRTESLPTVS